MLIGCSRCTVRTPLELFCFKTKSVKNKESIQGLHTGLVQPADGKAHQRASAQREPSQGVKHIAFRLTAVSFAVFHSPGEILTDFQS